MMGFARKLRGIQYNPEEKLKNRLGLATDEPKSRIIEELERLSKKSKATMKAIPLTANDYRTYGLEVPESLK